jgi:hypothetical protein
VGEGHLTLQGTDINSNCIYGRGTSGEKAAGGGRAAHRRGSGADFGGPGRDGEPPGAGAGAPARSHAVRFVAHESCRADALYAAVGTLVPTMARRAINPAAPAAAVYLILGHYSVKAMRVTWRLCPRLLLN